MMCTGKRLAERYKEGGNKSCGVGVDVDVEREER